MRYPAYHRHLGKILLNFFVLSPNRHTGKGRREVFKAESSIDRLAKAVGSF